MYIHAFASLALGLHNVWISFVMINQMQSRNCRFEQLIQRFEIDIWCIYSTSDGIPAEVIAPDH